MIYCAGLLGELKLGHEECVYHRRVKAKADTLGTALERIFNAHATSAGAPLLVGEYAPNLVRSKEWEAEIV